MLQHPHPTISPTNSGSRYPLAYNQRALWFLQKLNPTSAANNIPVALRIRTRMDPEVLRRAFQQFVDRHAALRTTFPAVDGEPWQVVHEHVDVVFHVEDATSWDDAQLDARLAEDTYTPFDLEREPPFRVTLLQRPHGESMLLLAQHHIVTDLWSLAILLSEVPQLYQAELTGVRADLKPPRIEYTDHVRCAVENA